MIGMLQLLACATCYGDPMSSQTQGMNFGILTMLGVTVLVLGSCAGFMITLARRARRHAAFEAELEQILKETNV